MKDEKGLYYYPFPHNKCIRTYVRQAEGTIWFRLWNSDVPEVWVEHGWVPYGAIKQASAMFKSNDFDPNQAYDIVLAQALLKEGG